MRTENLEKLDKEIKKNNMYSCYTDEYTICVVTSDSEYYISESGAINYFGIEKRTPFNESEYYAVNGINNVISLLKEGK